MSWLYLPAQAVDCSEASWSEIDELSVMSNGTPIASRYSKQESGMGISMTPQFGMMPTVSTGVPGLDRWISSLQDSPVNPSPMPDWGSKMPTHATDGLPPSGSYARYDPDFCNWRMWQLSFLNDTSGKYSVIWSRAGIVFDGIAYRLRPSAPLMRGIGYGLSLPTPTVATGSYQRNPRGRRFIRMSLYGMARHNQWPDRYATPQARDWRTGSPERWKEARKGIRSCNLNDQVGGKLNPDWVEWLMGWPIGWSALEPLAMGKFQEWLGKHGIY